MALPSLPSAPPSIRATSLIRSLGESRRTLVFVRSPSTRFSTRNWCAAIAALAVSGLDTRRFTFEGFLPSGKKERRAALEELTGEARTMVFHEAPHRLRQTLADMVELLGDRPAALCRELTKLHEDTVRTTLAQAAAFYRDNEPRGEYVLVVAGREKQNLPALTLEEGAARVLALRDGGMKLKEAVRRVADDTGLPRNALYDTALKA